MSGVLTVAIILVAALAGLVVIPLISVFISLLRTPYWPTKITPLVWQPQLSPDQHAAVNELAQLGFRQVVAYRSNMGPLCADGVFFQHYERAAFARLTFLGGLHGAYLVEFYSFTADRGTLVTLNRIGWAQTVSHPDANIADAFAGSLAEHWEYHEARMAQAALVYLEASEANRLITSYANTLPYMIERGWVVKGRDDAWHRTLRTTWRMSLAFFKVRPKLARPYHSSYTTGPDRTACFAKIYEQIEAVNAAKPPRPDVKAGLLILTLAASLAIWGNLFDWEYAAILVLVLLIHEAGHAIAMRAFGYRDISMFFIPFFGAAVTGTAKEMRAWKQAIVLLAGPIPGLIAAAAFFIYRGLYPFETSFFDFGKIAFVAGFVNLSNLLPLTPLDGGRLLEISVFGRWPRARLALAALSVLAFAALAIWLQDPLILPIIVLFAIGLLGQRRLAVLQRTWKEGISPHDQLLNLFEAARQSFGEQAFARHYLLIKAVFNQRKIRPARAWESLSVLLFMLIIWGGVGAIAFDVWQHDRKTVVTRSDDRTAAQKAFDKAFNAYDEEEEGAPTLAAVETLGAKLDPSDRRRFDIEVLKAWVLPAADRLQQIEVLLMQKRDGIVYRTRDIADYLLSATIAENKQKPAIEQASQLRSSIERVLLLSPESVPISYRLKLAKMISESGDAAAALNELQSLKASLIASKADLSLLGDVMRAEAWFYISQDKAEQAKTLLEAAMSNEMKGAPEKLAFEYAWALLYMGHVELAEQKMRLAAYAPPPKLSFVQKMFGVTHKPKLRYPLELAYAMIKNHEGAEAAKLVAQEAPSICRSKPAIWDGPWYDLRNRAILTAYTAVCANLRNGAVAAGKGT